MKSGPALQESANDRFNRLMQESARSLKESNDLLGAPLN
jgi:hypothetical protein